MSQADFPKERFTPTRGASSWLWLSFFIILVDQTTKVLVVSTLEFTRYINLLPILRITRLHNTGAAFGLFPGQRWFFISLAVVVSVVLMVWLRRLKMPEQTLLAVGLSLVLGGALGNVIDRVWYGYVVDFIDLMWQGKSFFPAFNVADSAITIGAGCLLLDAFREGGRKPEPEKRPS